MKKIIAFGVIAILLFIACSLFTESECKNCDRLTDDLIDGYCISCFNEKHDYDALCCYCGEWIYDTPHYIKSYCDECAKIDYPEYFCLDCGIYSPSENSLILNHCYKCYTEISDIISTTDFNALSFAAVPQRYAVPLELEHPYTDLGKCVRCKDNEAVSDDGYCIDCEKELFPERYCNSCKKWLGYDNIIYFDCLCYRCAVKSYPMHFCKDCKQLVSLTNTKDGHCFSCLYNLKLNQ